MLDQLGVAALPCEVITWPTDPFVPKLPKPIVVEMTTDALCVCCAVQVKVVPLIEVHAGVALPCEVITCPLVPIVPKPPKPIVVETITVLLYVCWAVQVLVEAKSAFAEAGLAHTGNAPGPALCRNCPF